jgi:hemin uptake protein HemP
LEARLLPPSVIDANSPHLALENALATNSQLHYKRLVWQAETGHMRMIGKDKNIGREGPSLPKIDASQLLASSREIILVHKDTEYRLRLTSNDKLILTK